MSQAVEQVTHRERLADVVFGEDSAFRIEHAGLLRDAAGGQRDVGSDDDVAGTGLFGDIVITSDIPLAARCIAKQARVLDPKGRVFTEHDIGETLAMRDLLDGLRQDGAVTGGPAPMTSKDRSKFLSKLDELINAVRRVHSPK